MQDVRVFVAVLFLIGLSSIHAGDIHEPDPAAHSIEEFYWKAEQIHPKPTGVVRLLVILLHLHGAMGTSEIPDDMQSGVGKCYKTLTKVVYQCAKKTIDTLLKANSTLHVTKFDKNSHLHRADKCLSEGYTDAHIFDKFAHPAIECAKHAGAGAGDAGGH